jgi:signal transduction histidine kinase
LSALAETVVEQLEAVADARDVHLAVTIDSGVEVIGDAGWLERLLIILIDNAVKFTPAGGRVSVRVARDGAWALMEVSDTGIGMSTGDASRVFERFYRADPARSRSTEGAGLGLTLAQWIAVRHRGAIDVASRPGAGSVFTVRLPAAPDDRTEPAL